MIDALQRRLTALAASPSAADREVGRRLTEQLRRPVQLGAAPSDADARSRWSHVDLVGLLEAFGNRVELRGETARSGHEPSHGSKSGTCLAAWPSSGRWWCSSCGRSGDAASYVVGALGIGYREASAWLAERYGAPEPVSSAPGRLHRPKPVYRPAARRVSLGTV